jgi:hypothetical protein
MQPPSSAVGKRRTTKKGRETPVQRLDEAEEEGEASATRKSGVGAWRVGRRVDGSFARE